MNKIELIVNYLTLQFRECNEINESEIDSFLEKLKNVFTDESDNSFHKAKAIYTSINAIKLETGSIIEDIEHKKWFLNRKIDLEMKFWERYKKYLLYDMKFSNDVVNVMDDILDKLTDLQGDPITDSGFQRRGLVIGDVQSGKTSNYTGLICKAADANYEVIVLLTGTIEKLRKQTQMRLDEGFVGFDSSALVKERKEKNIGVSKFDRSIRAAVLTTTMDDFKKSTAKSLGFDLNSINVPVLFVVKKNVTVLKRLNKWLKTFNSDGMKAIEHSLLLIDDEADNASVNTNPEDKNPTKINEQITELLALFKKASYVGFTATPYANIFIDPYTDEQMISDNLFPKDYIYSLNPPSNYMGARDIFGEFGRYANVCVAFSEEEETEIEALIPLKHKKDHEIDSLPSSLIYAIDVFLLANVIRDLRGDKTKHRSMLVNVSRFTDVQDRLHNMVNSELKNTQNAAKVNANLDIELAEKDRVIRRIKKAFYKEFSNCEYKWNEILLNLYKGIGSIQVLAINQKSDDKLDYEEYEEGLRVIVIGGLSLSRGLTLEGLMTSYLYRSTRMYDTLLQMGRWFGYRPNYEDLCKIYLTNTSIDWYRHISEATDELRRDIKRYENTGLTPMEFGLRVRSDINTLLVTARNKMRTAGERTCTISLSEVAIESTDIFIDNDKNTRNLNLIKRLIQDIKSAGCEVDTFGSSHAITKVPKKYILEFLEDIELPVSNEYLDPIALSQFVKKYEGNELEFWDVGFINGSENKWFSIDERNSTKYLARSFSVVGNNNDIVRMSGKSRRLGNVSDGRIGIRIDNTKLKNRIFDIEKRFGSTRIEPRNLKQDDYFKREFIRMDRRPLLNIYSIILKYVETDKIRDRKDHEERELLEKFRGKEVYGIGVGIPYLLNAKTKFASYKVNKIYQELISEYDIGDEE